MITRIIKFTVKPAEQTSFKALFGAAMAGTQQEDGAEEVRLFVDNNNPDLFFAYERFEDQPAVDHHARQGYTRTLLDFLENADILVEQLDLDDTMPVPDHSLKQLNPEDDVFIVFFIFKLREGYRAQTLAQFESYVQRTRKEPGNILFDLYTVDGDDDTLVVYEHWRKESDLWDVHFKQPYAEKTGALLSEAVGGDLVQYMSFVTEVALLPE